MTSQHPAPSGVEPWFRAGEVRGRWWQHWTLGAAWFACLITSGLSAEVIELPIPIVALVSGLAGLPFLFGAVAFVRKSLTAHTTFNVVGWLLVRSNLGGVAARLGDDRWLSRESQPGLFWSNVLFVGGVPGGFGVLGLWTLCLGLVDVVRLLPFWLSTV